MKFFDTHCHLDMLEPVKQSGTIDAVIAAAQDAGVDRLVCVGVELEQSKSLLDLTEGHDWIRNTAGLHPLHTADEEPDAEQLRAIAGNERVVAVGETGLDYHYETVPQDIQRQRLRSHVEVARDIDKPLIIHTREAGADTLSILEESGARDCGGVIHCFTETLDFARQALDLGFYISFSGIVTFRNASALREVAAYVPLDRILVETDAPYLAPVPHRGKENQPAWVTEVAACLAEVRSEPVERIAEQTRSNGLAFFGMQ
ncbi:MAG: TatD family hydrolase [Gammaproteobacteria bacterium]|nr:TatD family hydrolase [Gammaproteobacteria bacterium]